MTYDTRFDPNHWTASDGRVLPVDGTHDVHRVEEGELRGICTLVKTRERADRFQVGQQVEWDYDTKGGRAQGMVIAIARSRVQVMWRRVRKQPRPIWKRAIDLRVVPS